MLKGYWSRPGWWSGSSSSSSGSCSLVLSFLSQDDIPPLMKGKEGDIGIDDMPCHSIIVGIPVRVLKGLRLDQGWEVTKEERPLRSLMRVHFDCHLRH
jgi:hypothetical protein